MALTASLLLGLSPPAVFAAGETCEIVRDGSVYAAYMTLGEALPQLHSGDTLHLLADINYAGYILLTGTAANIFNLTIDLDGHVLNLNSNGSTGAMDLRYANVSLANVGGGALNITGGDTGGTYLNAYYSTVTVSSIKAWPDFYWHTVLLAQYSTVTVLGDVESLGSTNGAAGIGNNNVEAIRSYLTKLTIGGNVISRGSLGAGLYAEGGNDIYVGGSIQSSGYSSSSLYTYGGADHPNKVVIEGDVNRIVTVNADDDVTIDGNANGEVYCFGGTITVLKNAAGVVNCSNSGVVNVLGSVFVNVGSAYGIYSGIIINKGGVVHVAGDATCNMTDLSISGTASYAIRTSGNTSTDTVGMTLIDGNVNAAIFYAVSSGPLSETTINGTVSSTGYMLFDDGSNDKTSKTEADYEPITTKDGYRTYQYPFANFGNKTGTVWVRIPGSQTETWAYNALAVNQTSGKPYLSPGDNLLLKLYGDSGAAGTATVTYDDPVNGLTDATQTVALTEGQIGGAASGIYTGTFAITEGMSAIKGVTFALTAPGKTPAGISLPASKLPEIRGRLKVNIVNPYPGYVITGLLTASGSHGGNSVQLSGGDSAIIDGLPAGNDYTLRISDPDGYVSGSTGGIEIKQGQTAEADLNVTASAAVSVRLLDDPAIGTYNTKITVRDADTKAILGSLTAGTNGPPASVKNLSVGRKLELFVPGGLKSIVAGGVNEYIYYPDIVKEVTTGPGLNTAEIDLRDYANVYRRDATLQGTVTVGNGGGTTVPGAKAAVRVTQTAPDGSSVNFDTTADENGFYSLLVYPNVSRVY